MSRKIDIENINLKVDRIDPFELDGDKAFSKKLLELWMEQMLIVG